MSSIKIIFNIFNVSKKSAISKKENNWQNEDIMSANGKLCNVAWQKWHAVMRIAIACWAIRQPHSQEGTMHLF